MSRAKRELKGRCPATHVPAAGYPHGLIPKTPWDWILTGVAVPLIIAGLVFIHEAEWIHTTQDGVGALRSILSKPTEASKQYEASSHSNLSKTRPSTPSASTIAKFDLAEELNQFDRLIQLEKDAQAYRRGHDLIEKLPADMRALLQHAFIQDAAVEYRKDNFGAAARLMQDALRPLTINSEKQR